MPAIGDRVRIIPASLKDKRDRELYGGETGVVVDYSPPSINAPWLVWLRAFRAARWFADANLEPIDDQGIVIERRGPGRVLIKTGGTDAGTDA